MSDLILLIRALGGLFGFPDLSIKPCVVFPVAITDLSFANTLYSIFKRAEGGSDIDVIIINSSSNFALF